MANDHISREAAIDFLIPADDLNISAQDKKVIADRFTEFIKSIPAADVRPVVRGTWEPGETIFFCGVEHTAPRTCSVCGRSALDKPWYFCPNCGADMREVNND